MSTTKNVKEILSSYTPDKFLRIDASFGGKLRHYEGILKKYNVVSMNSWDPNDAHFLLYHSNGGWDTILVSDVITIDDNDSYDERMVSFLSKWQRAEDGTFKRVALRGG